MPNNYWPENTQDTLYLDSFAPTTLEYILMVSRRHFMNENLTMEDVDVSIEHIHTACVGYDQYVSSDYTNFFVITLVKHD